MLRWLGLWLFSCRSCCISGNKELQKSAFGDRAIRVSEDQESADRLMVPDDRMKKHAAADWLAAKDQ